MLGQQCQILGLFSQIFKYLVIQILMQAWDQDFKQQLDELAISIEQIEALGGEGINKEEEKKLKKKLKKYAVEKNDNVEVALDKTKKLLDEIYKVYETASKQSRKTLTIKATVDSSKAERDNSVNQLKFLEGLQKQFRKKYDDLLKSAQDIEKEEENKRKVLIEQLQSRIKTAQEEYEAAGKEKIEKFRENETLKHELMKIEPQVATTETLMDAQLKKKQIEIEIQMTTLQQKIQMMQNFKKVSEQTQVKLEVSKITEQKIAKRLQVLDAKENENKLVVARAHLLLQDYRKSIMRINELLTKHEKEAIKAQDSLRKKTESVVELDRTIQRSEKELEASRSQIQVLLTLEQTLKKEVTA